MWCRLLLTFDTKAYHLLLCIVPDRRQRYSRPEHGDHVDWISIRVDYRGCGFGWRSLGRQRWCRCWGRRWCWCNPQCEQLVRRSRRLATSRIHIAEHPSNDAKLRPTNDNTWQHWPAVFWHRRVAAAIEWVARTVEHKTCHGRNLCARLFFHRSTLSCRGWWIMAPVVCNWQWIPGGGGDGVSSRLPIESVLEQVL